MITHNGKHNGGVHMFDGMPQTLVHGAEEGATKVAEVVESAGARIAKGRILHPQLDIKDAKLSMKDAKLGMREARLGVREMIVRSMLKRRARLIPATDAMLKAQLVRTSRELAHESSDLNATVDTLNRIIRTNRRAAASGRTRLLGGLALGAVIMYHLDADQGHQRRAASGRLMLSMLRGQRAH